MALANQGSKNELLFLTDERLRAQIELLFFGYRAFTSDADRILEKYGLGRAHHRVLYFITRKPGLNVGDLLSILNISKQSLNRVLRPLVDQEFVTNTVDETDRRARNLNLTQKGRTLETELATAQMARLRRAFSRAGPEAVRGFSNVLTEMLDPDALRMVEALSRAEDFR